MTADYQGNFGRKFKEACAEMRALLNAIEVTIISERIEQHLKEIEGLARKYRKVLKAQREAISDTRQNG